MERLFCLLAVFLLVRGTNSMNWEFGQDDRELKVVGQLSGDIKPTEKVKQITIPLAPCMVIMYLYVEVWNQISTPAVKFKRDINTVTITYTLLQASKSSYLITAKGRRSQLCGDGEKGNKEHDDENVEESKDESGGNRYQGVDEDYLVNRGRYQGDVKSNYGNNGRYNGDRERYHVNGERYKNDGGVYQGDDDVNQGDSGGYHGDDGRYQDSSGKYQSNGRDCNQGDDKEHHSNVIIIIAPA